MARLPFFGVRYYECAEETHHAHSSGKMETHSKGQPTSSALFVSVSPKHRGREAAACGAADRLRPLKE